MSVTVLAFYRRKSIQKRSPLFLVGHDDWRRPGAGRRLHDTVPKHFLHLSADGLLFQLTDLIRICPNRQMITRINFVFSDGGRRISISCRYSAGTFLTMSQRNFGVDFESGGPNDRLPTPSSSKVAHSAGSKPQPQEFPSLIEKL